MQVKTLVNGELRQANTDEKGFYPITGLGPVHFRDHTASSILGQMIVIFPRDPDLEETTIINSFRFQIGMKTALL